VYRRKIKEGRRRRESEKYPFHPFQAFHKGDDMIPEPRTFPIFDDANPCAVLNCNDALQLLEVCEKKRRCPHAWTKRARLDRQEREEKDSARAGEERNRQE